MVERKYAAPCFAKMSGEQLELAADNILMKLHVITGWQMPQNELFQDELARQLSLKLKESYPTVNIVEIEFAFRNNTTVKDWGKNMNLALIDEVMIPYLNDRSEASESERCAVKHIELPAPEITDEDSIQTARDIYKATKNHHYIAYGVYNRLLKAKLIQLSSEQKEAVKTQAKTIIQNSLNDDKNFLGDISEEKYLNRLCKKLAVARYFDNE